MKKVEAIIREEKLTELKLAVDQKFKTNGMTITQVLGCGKQKGSAEFIHESATITSLLPKVQVSFVVADEEVEAVISMIVNLCSSDEIGDGKIFVYNVEEAVRIRTQERGQEAI